MSGLNKDTIVAIILLCLCAVFFWASFDIRQPDYGVLMPSTWPRVIIVTLSILCFIYLVQSIRAGPDKEVLEREPGLIGFIKYWRNPLCCFVMFFDFLASMPVLGMLIGGVTFVFLLMGLLGGWAPRQMVIHASVAIISVGSMWSLFTFGLGVMLPVGMIFNPYAL